MIDLLLSATRFSAVAIGGGKKKEKERGKRGSKAESVF